MLAISLNPIDWVTDAAGAVIGGAAETVLDAVVSWLEDGVRYVATVIANGLVVALFDHTPALASVAMTPTG